MKEKETIPAKISNTYIFHGISHHFMKTKQLNYTIPLSFKWTPQCRSWEGGPKGAPWWLQPVWSSGEVGVRVDLGDLEGQELWRALVVETKHEAWASTPCSLVGQECAEQPHL